MRSAETEEESESVSTPRLVLKPIGAGEAEALTRLAANTIGDELADARAFIARARLSVGGEAFALIERGTGRLIGAAAHAPMADWPERREIALWVSPQDWGHGYATEAAQALIDRLFTTGRVDAVWGVTRVTNQRGRRIMEKCGFQARENGMARSVALRGAMPVERFVLERRTWIGLKAWGAVVAGRGGGDAGDFAA